LADSLVIKRKIEDAIVYSFQALTHFPKSERFTSAAESPEELAAISY